MFKYHGKEIEITEWPSGRPWPERITVDGQPMSYCQEWENTAGGQLISYRLDESEIITRTRIEKRVFFAAPFLTLLAEAGLSQSECARRFGIPLRTVQNWASGQRVCPDYTLNMMRQLVALDGAPESAPKG